MRTVFFLICLLLSGLSAEDRLLFQNNDIWYGDIQEFKNKQFRFKSELAEESLHFRPDYLKAAYFDQEVKSNSGSYDVYLTNGDGITGDLVEFNEKFLVIKTDMAGILQIPRAVVKDVILKKKGLLSKGVASGEWKGSIDAHGTFRNISRPFSCNEPVVITIEVENALGLNCTLSCLSKTGSVRSYMTVGHAVNTHGRMQALKGAENVPEYLTVNAKVYHKTTDFRLSGEKFNLSEKLKLQMFIDPEKGFLGYLANGRILGKVDKLGKLVIANAKLGLYGPGNVSLKGFKVEKWSGIFNSTSNLTSKNEDNVFLTNGDIAHCKVLKIKDSFLHFETTSGPLKVPLERVDSFTLINALKSKAPASVQLVQNNGMKLSGLLQKVDDKKISLRSELLDLVSLNRQYFTSIINNGPGTGRKAHALQIGRHRIIGKVKALENSRVVIENENLVSRIPLKSTGLEALNSTTNVEERQSWSVELISGEIIPFKDIQLTGNTFALKLVTDSLKINKNLVSSIGQCTTGISKSLKNEHYPLPAKSVIYCWLNKDSFNPKRDSIKFNLFRGNKQRLGYFTTVSEKPSSRFSRGLRKVEHKKLDLLKTKLIALKIDKAKAEFELWADGVHTHTFTDPAGYQADGDSVSISKAKEVRFRPWLSEAMASQSYLVKKDWSVQKGEISKIEKGIISIGGDVFKMSEINEINLTDKKSPYKYGIYTVSFLHGGSVQADSFRITDSKLVITHKLLGEVHIDMFSIASILKNK